jgi:hypothetical protein
MYKFAVTTILMAFTGISINTGVHICLPYFEEMVTCADNHVYSQFECKNQIQDYMECHNRNKYVQVTNNADEKYQRC